MRETSNSYASSVPSSGNINLAQNTIKGKHLIATEIVCGIRAMVPADRFLKKNNDTTTWFDIGDAKAIKKKLHRLFEKH